MAFTSRGRKQFKGIAEPIAVYAATAATPSVAGAGIAPPARPPITTRLLGLGDPRRVVVAGAGAAGAVALAALLMVGALGGAFGPGPSLRPSGTVAGSVAASGSPTPGAPTVSPTSTMYTFGFGGPQNGVIGHDAGGNVLLAAGAYVEGDPELPHLVMKLGSGWSLADRPNTSVGLIRSDDPNDFVGFSWPTQVPTDACGTATRPLSASPSDYTLWLQQTPALSVTPPITRYFGTLVAQQADLTVVVKYACPGTNPPALIVDPTIFFSKLGEAWPVGLRYRVAFGLVDRRLLRILIQAPDDQSFQAFDPLVETLLATIAVAPGPATTASGAP
jgi:hypothetical protein